MRGVWAGVWLPWLLIAWTGWAETPPHPSLVRVDRYLPGVIIDMRYATTNNFTGKVIYRDPHAYLRRETVTALRQVVERLDRQGYRLVILDAYRPPWAQQKLWEAFPNANFVAPPRGGGSRHSRGTTVDVTLADRSGKLLEMPTAYDAFVPAAAHGYAKLPGPVLKRRHDLLNAFLSSGFSGVPAEWWHYDLANWPKYPVIEPTERP